MGLVIVTAMGRIYRIPLEIVPISKGEDSLSIPLADGDEVVSVVIEETRRK